MCSLFENKPLLYSITGSFGLVTLLITGAMPELSEQFSIVPFPVEVNFLCVFVCMDLCFNLVYAFNPVPAHFALCTLLRSGTGHRGGSYL